MILRAEKGFIGKDTDGTTMPHDLGRPAARIRGRTKYGKRSLFTPVANDPRRKQLVGLSVPSGEAPLPTGAHVTAGAGRARRSQGDVMFEHSVRAWAARSRLAVEDGRSRMGETVGVYHLGAERRATIQTRSRSIAWRLDA